MRVLTVTDPVIFRPLKSFTFADSQQESLLRLAQEGISVYSPHTAVDATIGGVNDWLADGISGGARNEESRAVIVPVEGPVGPFTPSIAALVDMALKCMQGSSLRGWAGW